MHVSFFSQGLVLLCLLACMGPVPVHSGNDQHRIMVTLREPNACKLGESVLSGSSATCVTVVKCYGRRMLLNVQACPEEAIADDRRDREIQMHRRHWNHENVSSESLRRDHGPGRYKNVPGSDWVRKRFPPGLVVMVEIDPTATQMPTPPVRERDHDASLDSEAAVRWNMDMVRTRQLWQSFPGAYCTPQCHQIHTNMIEDVDLLLAADACSSKTVRSMYTTVSHLLCDHGRMDICGGVGHLNSNSLTSFFHQIACFLMARRPGFH